MLKRLQTALANPVHVIVALFALVPIVWQAVFIYAYRVNLPIIDSLLRSYPLAVAVRNGTATLSDFFTPYVGHIALLSYSLTGLLAWLGGWNLHIEVLVGFLFMVACYPVMLYMVHKTEPRALVVAAIPLALLYFNVRQDRVMLVGYVSMAWQPIALFLLAALCLLCCTQRQAWVPLAAFGLAALATFTHGQGFLLLWLVLAGCWVAGYRSWVLFALGGAFAVGWTLLYMTMAEVIFTSGGGGTNNVVDINALLQVIPFSVSFISIVFSSNVRVGQVGVLLFVLNAAYLLRYPQYRRYVGMWALVATYTIGTAALVAITRGTGYDNAATQPQFVTPALLFWVALVALASVVLVREWHADGWRYGLVVVNLVVAGYAGVLWVSGFNTTPYFDHRYINEGCHRRYMYLQDVTPLRETRCVLIGELDAVNVLAYYDMAMFAGLPAGDILPETYTPGTRVVVAAQDGWSSYHITRWLLNDVPDDDIIHLNETPPISYPAHNVSLELPEAFLTGDEGALASQLEDETSFWLVRMNHENITLPAPLREDYVTVDYERLVEGITFEMALYQKVEISDETPIRFGDGIQMIGYTSLSDRLEACTSVTVRSFWGVLSPPLLDGYSATLTLDRVTGSGVWDFENVVRVDSALTLTPTNTWEPGEIYVDERTLAIPCDLPPGEYALQLGVYNYRDGRRLPPYVDEQPPAPEQDIARIETVVVE